MPQYFEFLLGSGTAVGNLPEQVPSTDVDIDSYTILTDTDFPYSSSTYFSVDSDGALSYETSAGLDGLNLEETNLPTLARAHGLTGEIKGLAYYGNVNSETEVAPEDERLYVAQGDSSSTTITVMDRFGYVLKSSTIADLAASTAPVGLTSYGENLYLSMWGGGTAGYIYVLNRETLVIDSTATITTSIQLGGLTATKTRIYGVENISSDIVVYNRSNGNQINDERITIAEPSGCFFDALTVVDNIKTDDTPTDFYILCRAHNDIYHSDTSGTITRVINSRRIRSGMCFTGSLVVAPTFNNKFQTYNVVSSSEFTENAENTKTADSDYIYLKLQYEDSSSNTYTNIIRIAFSSFLTFHAANVTGDGITEDEISVENIIRTSSKNDVISSMFDSIPRFYGDSVVLENIFKAIKPELDEIYFLSSAYDKSSRNEDVRINKEIEYILNSASENDNDIEIGFGNPKILYQNFIVSSNISAKDYARLYQVTYSEEDEKNFKKLKQRILFKTRSNDYLSNEDIIEEFDYIFPNAIDSITNDYANYSVDIVLNENAPANITEFAKEKIRQVLPAHLIYTFSSSSTLLLSKDPHGKFSDNVGYTVS